MGRKQQKEEELKLSKPRLADCRVDVRDLPNRFSFNPLPINFAINSEYRKRRKDQKKVDKLTAQIPYHEGRGNKDEVTKIKEQVESIWQKARDAQFA
ncbi:hypothetical protein THAOC_27029 [Thalassiosira oceanica]|uniref:Enkurin domain-containing protein n=1 Tax=Thalassiosira oceanica TaxID=159749 RepID=K0S3Q5_THAOC|nr:hypothetical protein THAOC_27029 [Thalassiosira oceanica]|eukprot:EJK53522.1 hypothetical protein THAOC_27029 [Thalassiosira oceanica]